MRHARQAKEGGWIIREIQKSSSEENKEVKGKYGGSDEVAGVPARLEIDSEGQCISEAQVRSEGQGSA